MLLSRPPHSAAGAAGLPELRAAGDDQPQAQGEVLLLLRGRLHGAGHAGQGHDDDDGDDDDDDDDSGSRLVQDRGQRTLHLQPADHDRPQVRFPIPIIITHVNISVISIPFQGQGCSRVQKEAAEPVRHRLHHPAAEW